VSRTSLLQVGTRDTVSAWLQTVGPALAPAAYATDADAVPTTDAILASAIAYATDAIAAIVHHPRPIIATVVTHATDAIPAVIAAIA